MSPCPHPRAACFRRCGCTAAMEDSETGTASERVNSSYARWRVVVYAAAALGIFVLPYYVPFSTEVYSVSRTYGFNNRVAVVAALVGVALAAILNWLILNRFDRRRREPETSAVAIEPLDTASGSIPVWPLIVALAASAVNMSARATMSGHTGID